MTNITKKGKLKANEKKAATASSREMKKQTQMQLNAFANDVSRTLDGSSTNDNCPRSPANCFLFVT